MRNLIDLKRMRYIVEVARAEAITTAAEVLAISQPALTRNIAEVEEELGVQLFHRLPRGIEVTEEGKKFISRARRILGDVDNLIAEMQEAPGLSTGRLRVGFAPAGYVDHAKPALEQLAKDHPGVSIETATGTAQTLCPRLLHGELNLIVGSNRYLERWKELHVQRIKELYFACMLRKKHPLAGLNEIKEADILKLPAVLPASVEPMYTDIAQRYVSNGLDPIQPKYITDDFDLVCRLIRATDAFYPVMHSEPDFGQIGKAFLMIPDIVKIPSHYISVATSPYRPKTALTELFEELLLNSLA